MYPAGGSLITQTQRLDLKNSVVAVTRIDKTQHNRPILILIVGVMKTKPGMLMNLLHFLPRDAKLGLCSRPVSVRLLSVCVSVCVSCSCCIHMAEDIVKFLSRPGSSSLYFCPCASVPNSKGLYTPGVGRFAIFD